MVKWLDKTFVESALQVSFNDPSIKVKNIVLRPTSLDGVNYGSSIYRLLLSYECKSKTHADLTLIVKLITGKVNSLATKLSYDTEVMMYQRVIPDIERLLSINGSKDQKIGPQLIFSTTDPIPTIFFEDLVESKFLMLRKRCDFNDLMIITEKLAKFHAASYHLSKENDKLVTRFNTGLFNMKDNDGVKFIHESFGIFCDVVQEWEGFECYVDKLKIANDTFLEKASQIYAINERGLNVLNHGDFHYNNFMVKQSNGNGIEDVIFLDYQLCVFATPAIDFFYMLYMVTSDKAREHRVEIVCKYYEAFKRNLTDMGFIGKVPTLLDFNVELISSGFLELIIAVCFVPFFHVDEIKSTTEEAISTSTRDLRVKLFNSEGYRKMIGTWLQEFSLKGIL